MPAKTKAAAKTIHALLLANQAHRAKQITPRMIPITNLFVRILKKLIYFSLLFRRRNRYRYNLRNIIHSWQLFVGSQSSGQDQMLFPVLAVIHAPLAADQPAAVRGVESAKKWQNDLATVGMPGPDTVGIVAVQ